MQNITLKCIDVEVPTALKLEAEMPRKSDRQRILPFVIFALDAGDDEDSQNGKRAEDRQLAEEYNLD